MINVAIDLNSGTRQKAMRAHTRSFHRTDVYPALAVRRGEAESPSRVVFNGRLPARAGELEK